MIHKIHSKSCEGCPDVKPGTITRLRAKPDVPSFKGARVMEDKSILFAKSEKDWEPPPEPEGYTRDPENPWRFLPAWPECKKRLQTPFVKPCGAIRILTICNCPGCPLRREEVTVAQCESCEHRKE